MRRAILGLVAGAVALVAAAGTGTAQSPAPTVEVSAGATAVSLQPTGPLAAGPTRFNVTRQGTKDVSVYVFVLNPGVTFDEFKAEMERDDRTEGDTALGLVWIQGSTMVGGTPRAVTVNLRPGQTYYILSELDEEPARGQARQRGITSFTTSGEANGAAPPSAGATVRMEGLRFRGNATLPRRGVVRFDNNDGTEHFAIAFPLRKGVTTSRVRRALRSNSERAFGRILSGAPYFAQGLISGGGITNYQEVAFPKSGKYALICFIYEHHELGMIRIVRVR